MIHRFKNNVTSNDVWPVILPMAITTLANPLHQYLGVPVSFTNMLAGLLLVGWLVFYGLKVWRNSNRDNRIYAEKVATAEAQLFGPRHNS